MRSDLYTTTLLNGGSAWSAPNAIGVTTSSEYAIQGGPAGVVYVAFTDGTAGNMQFLYSTDSGVSWSSPVIIVASTTGTAVSMATDGDYIYVLAEVGTGLKLAINSARGVGAFATTSIPISVAFCDVVVDSATGHVFVVANNPTFRIVESSDHGSTFGPETNPPGSAQFSDWSSGNHYIYAVGVSSASTPANDINVIPVADTTTSTTVPGLSPDDFTAQARAVSADLLGNSYVVSQNSTIIYLDKYQYGTPGTVVASMSFPVPGSFPAVAGLPCNRGALVVYGTTTGSVTAAVVTY